MIWRIRPEIIMYAVVTTSITGTIVTLAWYGIGKLLERLGFLHVLYDLLRAAALFWLVSAGYLMEQYYYPIVKGITILDCSPVIVRVSKCFCLVWFAGIALHLLWYLLQLLKLRLRLRAAIECETAVRQTFAEVCREYRLPEKWVRVLQSYRETVPKVVGVWRPCVLLPVKSYPKEELRLILKHELMHVRQMDPLTKNLGMLLRALHFFNPAAWWYVRLLNKWSEFACDYRVCVRNRNLKSYYRQLVDMAEREEVLRLVSRLVEDPEELKQRMEHVMKCYRCRKNRRTRAVAGLIVGCMLLASGGTVYAATKAGTRAVNVWADATKVVSEVPLQPLPELQEYMKGPGFDTVVVDGEVKYLTKGAKYYFDWDIAGETTYQSPSFQKVQGEIIKVSVSVDPMNLAVNVGIIQPDGNEVYVTGSEFIHSFTATQTGSYRVYIENRNSVRVAAVGYYY